MSVSDENPVYFDKKPIAFFKNHKVHIQIRVLRNILQPLSGQIGYFSGIPNEKIMATYKFKSLLYLLGFVFCAWLYYQTGTSEMLPENHSVAVASNSPDNADAGFSKL